jgi:hypothetical protein
VERGFRRRLEILSPRVASLDLNAMSEMSAMITLQIKLHR